MTDGPTLLAQERLGRGSAQTGLQGRRPGDLIDLHHAVETAQVETDHAGESGAVRRQPTHHGRPAGERHHRDPSLRTQPQDRNHFLVVARVHDEVGRVVGVTRAQPQDVRGGVPARVLHPCRVRVGDVVGADDSRDLFADSSIDRRPSRRDRPRVDAGVGFPVPGQRSRGAGQFGRARRVSPARPKHPHDGDRGFVGHVLAGHRTGPGRLPPVGAPPLSVSSRTIARTTSSAICSSLKKLSGMSMRE